MLILLSQVKSVLNAEAFITLTTGTILVNAAIILTVICWEQSTFATQLSMLAILLSDILHRELYALPYEG